MIDYASLPILPQLIPLDAGDGPSSAILTHNRTLLGYSMALGVIAAYACLEASGCAKMVSRRYALIWLFISGALLAIATWATHFGGMIALQSPLKRGFDVAMTLNSALFSIVCGALGFAAGGVKPGPLRYVGVGLWFAVCAIAMHYMGMLGLIMDAHITYRGEVVALTAVGAVIGSTFGYVLAQVLDKSWRRMVAAFAISATVSFLHYADMSAAVIQPNPQFYLSSPANNSDDLILLLTAVVIVPSTLALLAVWLVRWRSQRGNGQGSDWDHSEDDVVVVPMPGERPSSDEVVVADLSSRG